MVGGKNKNGIRERDALLSYVFYLISEWIMFCISYSCTYAVFPVILLCSLCDTSICNKFDAMFSPRYVESFFIDV